MMSTHDVSPDSKLQNQHVLQVSTSYLLQLGSNQNNYLFDVGGASLLNLYTTQTNLSTVDKV